MYKQLFERWYAFEDSLRLKSFSEAARSADETTSQISRRIKALEDELGVKLCERHRDGVTATEAGVRFLNEMSPLIRDFEALEESLGGQTRATLQLRTPVSLGSAVFSQLPARLAKTMKSSNESPLQVTPVHGPMPLPRMTTDMSVLIADEPPDADVIALRLGRIAYVSAAAPDYLNANGDPRTPDDLDFHRILRGPTAAMEKILFHCDWEEKTLTSHFVTDYETDLSLYTAALAGSGVAIGLPLFLAHKALADGRLVEVLPFWKIAPKTVWLLRVPQRFPDLATQRLMIAVKDLWANTPGCID